MYNIYVEASLVSTLSLMRVNRDLEKWWLLARPHTVPYPVTLTNSTLPGAHHLKSCEAVIITCVNSRRLGPQSPLWTRHSPRQTSPTSLQLLNPPIGLCGTQSLARPPHPPTLSSSMSIPRCFCSDETCFLSALPLPMTPLPQA